MSTESPFRSPRPVPDATRRQVTDIVCRVILANTGRPLVPEPDDRLIESGVLDSLSIADLAIALGTELGVQLDFGDLREETFGSIHAISRLVAEQNAARGTTS